jgi:hypothetical protein
LTGANIGLGTGNSTIDLNGNVYTNDEALLCFPLNSVAKAINSSKQITSAVPPAPAAIAGGI